MDEKPRRHFDPTVRIVCTISDIDVPPCAVVPADCAISCSSIAKP